VDVSGNIRNENNYTTRQPMNVRRNIEERSCNHCCMGKTTSITYSECVFVVLGIQHVMCMRSIFICGPLRSTNFFTRSQKWHDFQGGGELSKIKRVF